MIRRMKTPRVLGSGQPALRHRPRRIRRAGQSNPWGRDLRERAFSGDGRSRQIRWG